MSSAQPTTAHPKQHVPLARTADLDDPSPARALGTPGRAIAIILALAILLPSLWGFGSKFVEFIALYRGESDGTFAISPILNYLLASLGFLFLFGWGTLNGMFRDIEGPKHDLLEHERRLDQSPPGPNFTRSV